MSSFANAIQITGNAAPIDAADAIQKHPLGQRMILEDGRVFAYAKAYSEITTTSKGVKNVIPQGVQYRALAAAAAIGDRQVTVVCASADGLAGTGTIVKNEFVGGYMLLFSDSANQPVIRRITGNDAGTTAVVFYLDRGLPVAFTAGEYVEAMHSPYVGVAISTAAWQPVVGMPTVLCDADYYLWVQTWGICWAAPQAGAGLAGATGLIFKHDGSLEATYTTVDLNHSSQYAGHCISGTATGAQGAPFFMLQLAP